MNLNTCSKCMWYQRHTKPGLGTEFGSCRRSNPTNQGFPFVLPADWCGGFRMTERVVDGGGNRTSTYQDRVGNSKDGHRQAKDLVETVSV